MAAVAPPQLKVLKVFGDPTDSHLAYLYPPPKALRPTELVNPKAIAYHVPKSITIGVFKVAMKRTHAKLIKDTGAEVEWPFICGVSHCLGDGSFRMEIVYHEKLDAARLSTTPIVCQKQALCPLTSNMDYTITKIIFSEFQFQFSADLGQDLRAWVTDLLEGTKQLGKVILIQILLVPTPEGDHAPGHQVFVYVKKGDITPEAAGMERTHLLPHHQKNPIRIQWMGGRLYCNYCKGRTTVS
ncbi:hypothetical protein BGZ95_007665, partial [Linnemannia exigua]